MKMKVTEFFIRRPVLFWSLMAAILIAGVLSFIRMPKLEDPAVSIKQAMVAVSWPGASAHEMELEVAQLMEDELRALPNVKKVKTECRNGMALFTVEFQMTVLEEELEQHFDLLRRKVNDTALRLPQGCYDPVVIDDMMDVYGIFYALTADGYDYPEMYRYAKYLRHELLDVKGVKRINIVGNRDEVINIILSKEQISRNGVIPTQIMSALQTAGKTVNAGRYTDGSERIALYVDSAVQDEEDIRNLQIQTMDGKQLRIGDVARVERGYSTPQRNGFFVEGKPALAICIAMESSAIVPDVGKAVDARLAEAMQHVPAGFQTEKIFFQPDKVTDAISSFLWNLVESVIIVILVLIFTMGLRSGLIIGFGLVLTVAVSFPILLVCGTTLQRISLGAFIVAMGMLVDNAVVIMDGILVDKQRGLSPKVYLYRIGRNTAMPLLGATIIAASTFLCVYLSPDSAGEYAGDLFLVLCVSLLASWVLALVQVPVCAKSWLPSRIKRTPGESANVMNSPVHRFIRRAIGTLIGYKRTTLIVAFSLLIICIFGMTRVKNLFFPDFDYKQFVVECFFPSASDADRVRDRLLQMSEQLSENPELERIAVSQGSAPAHYCLVRPMTSGGDCYGELIVDCKDYKTVQEQIPHVRKQLREAFPDAYIRIRKYNFSISTTHTVEVEFSGPDPAVLRELSAQAEAIMRRSPYVDAYSVQNNWKPMGKALRAEYARQDALRSGIERSDVANALLAATEGMPVGVLTDQDRMVMLNLQVRNDDGSRISNLDEIPVWSMINLHLSNDELQGALAGGESMSSLQDKLFRGHAAEQRRPPDLARLGRGSRAAPERPPRHRGGVRPQPRLCGGDTGQGGLLDQEGDRSHPIARRLPDALGRRGRTPGGGDRQPDEIPAADHLHHSGHSAAPVQRLAEGAAHSALHPLRLLRHHPLAARQRPTDDLHGHHRHDGSDRHDGQERHRAGRRDQPTADRRAGFALYGRGRSDRVAYPAGANGLADNDRRHDSARLRSDVRVDGHHDHGRSDRRYDHHPHPAAHLLLRDVPYPQAEYLLKP